MTDTISPQLSLSLKFLETTGMIPVRVDYGHKRPPGDWNPKMIEGADHSVTLNDLRTGKYNVGALFHGKFVDVDVDNTNPFLMGALDYFLPYTNYVWGRPSKPRSHRAYALFEDFDREKFSSILTYIKKLEPGVVAEDSLSTELRGGKAESGMFTVLPGSWREDVKEEVQWDAGIDLSTSASYVDINDLMKALRLSVAAAIVAPHWLSGTRNDLSLALAGLLYRIRVSALASYGVEAEEDVPEGTFILTQKDAENLFDAIMILSGDCHGDEFTRVQNLRNTWKKMLADSGAKATGGKAVEKLIGEEWGQKVVKSLYRLLSDNTAAEEIESYLEQYVIWYGPGVLIDLDMVREGHPHPWMLKTQAEVSMGGTKVTIGGKKIPITSLLFGTKLVQRVRGLTFDPSTSEILLDTEGGKKVNAWTGIKVKPHPEPVTEKDVEPFLVYMKEIVANNDSGAYDWVLDWLADMMQCPAHKPGSALVLVGEQGAGKTFLGERIIRPIIGPTHSVSAPDVNALISNFNKLAENRIFVQVDEATSTGSRAAADKLKGLISDETITITPKGIDSYQAPNHLHMLFTSNRENTAVFIDGGNDRRYTVLNVNPRRARDVVWWAGFRSWVEANLSKILRFLLDREYDRNRVRRPYETRAKRVIQLNGLDAEVAYVLERLDAGFPISEGAHEHWFDAYNSATIDAKDKNADKLRRDEWPDTVRVGALEEDFRRWVRGRGHQVWGASVQKLRLFFAIEDQPRQMRVTYYDEKSRKQIDDRPRFYAMPKPEVILAALKAKYGDLIEDIQISVRNIVDNEKVKPSDDEGEY